MATMHARIDVLQHLTVSAQFLDAGSSNYGLPNSDPECERGAPARRNMRPPGDPLARTTFPSSLYHVFVAIRTRLTPRFALSPPLHHL